MFISTKDEILKQVIQDTRNFRIQDLDCFTANRIATRLNISRNLASQYLNELVKEDKLIKINSRPVYFIYKRGIESAYEVSISKNVFLSIDQFTDQLKTKRPDLKNFQKAIGYHSSLANCIGQCKAAMKYPPSGLPVVLTGQSGTGKSFFARLMYEYLQDENIIEKDAPFISVNCSKYANNPKQLISLLFGVNSNNCSGSECKEGLIQKASGGILFFDEAHNLNPQCQENLFMLMDRGPLQKSGDNGLRQHLQIRLIFATNKDPAETFLRALLRRIPVIVSLPPLCERSSEEKEEMILEFFKQEAKKINREILISEKVYRTLMKVEFSGNIGQLKSCIRTACANSFLHSEQRKAGLNIFLYDLPEYAFSSSAMDSSFDDMDDTSMINPYGLVPTSSTDKIINLYDSMLNTYEDYKNLKYDQKGLMNQEFSHLDNYFDHLINKEQYSDSKVQAIGNVVKKIFESISNEYCISFSDNYESLLTRSIYVQIQANPEIQTWEEKRKAILEEMLLFLQENYSKEFMVASKAENLIRQKMDIMLSSIGVVLCIVGVKYYNVSEHINDLEGIIMCHGCSTASSMASAANRLIGKRVYEAIDIPLDMSIDGTVKTLKMHMQRVSYCHNLIILVDMGSLEEIGEKYCRISNLNIGIITNVSTRLAVNVGLKICDGQDMQRILKSIETEKEIKPTIRMWVNQKKSDAIIFTCETGSGTAEKMSELFVSSLPKKIPIKIIPCNYIDLLQNADQNGILNQYNVIAIIGTLNPNLPDVTFIALEDIVNLNEIHQVTAYLSKYYNAEEIQEFNHNVLKNFSLQNVMQYLTILNADRLLDHVEEAVTRLQQAMRLKLSGRTLIGIYVHICCLVERLVTKNPIENHQNLDDFMENNKDFIRQMTESFSAISKYYGVQIPVSEIAYIYDYIANDKRTSDPSRHFKQENKDTRSYEF